MGVEPVRQPNGRVSGVAVVDLDQLRLVIDNVEMLRPRIDATIETSGIVRDMVPHFISLLDKAVAMVSQIDEPAERNMVRKHTRQQLEELKREAADLLSEKEMQRMAMFRVFSSAPGTYSSGVGLALDASAWQNEHDLAEAYVNQSGYAYGSMPQDFGRKAHELFARQLSKVEVSYIKQTSAEYDALDCDCYASYAGGMAAASTALSGKKTKMYWADTTVPGDIDVRDFKEKSKGR
ncbi:cobaltochelatase subunit CobN [Prosthecochloris sp. SCSIO W1101]|nr:cobaltochelatase subunit CobN [Prosthecochloris sp. SCSIO W1101]UZJ40161.1 cobaltochelatase subunit CobN [Prosthecochloris sp. SCSIO W1101]